MHEYCLSIGHTAISDIRSYDYSTVMLSFWCKHWGRWSIFVRPPAAVHFPVVFICVCSYIFTIYTAQIVACYRSFTSFTRGSVKNQVMNILIASLILASLTLGKFNSFLGSFSSDTPQQRPLQNFDENDVLAVLSFYYWFFMFHFCVRVYSSGGKRRIIRPKLSRECQH